MLGNSEGKRRSGWEDEMVEWHHQLNGHKSEQTLGGSEGHRGLVYCSPWGCKESDTTVPLNNNLLYIYMHWPI